MYTNSPDSFIIAQVPSTGSTTQTNQSAGTEVPAEQESSFGKQGGEGLLNNLLFPVLFLVVIYLLLLRPQYKKEKTRQAALKKMSKGDKVVTRGGVWGVVAGIKEDENITVVKIADNVKIEVSTDAIEKINPEADKKAKPSKS